jgi:WD40 repeat protein
MRGHTGWVVGAEISDDGELLVSGGADETVRLWDLDDASQILMVTEDADGSPLGFINGVAINPQKTHFASAGDDGFVYIWDRDGKEVARRVFSPPAVRVDFDPTGNRVLVVAGGAAFIWPWRDAEQPVVSLSGHKISGRNRTIAGRFSPDGSRVVTGGQDGRVIVWDASTASVIAEMDGHKGTVYDLAFSWDGTKIVSAGSDKTARIWDAETGEELRTLSGHESRLAAAAFSPDGTQVVTGTGGGTVGVWDVETGKNLAILRPHSEFVNAVAFHPDGTTIVSASDDHTVRRYQCVICDLDSLQTTAANRKGYARDLESQLASAQGRVEKVAYPWQLVAGDCLLTPDDLGSVEPVSLVPCEEEHQAEIIALVLHPAPFGAPYPGDSSILAVENAACRSAFTPYVGAQLEVSALSLGVPYGPLENTWDDGSRIITCWLEDPAGPMVGSMRNSGR